MAPDTQPSVAAGGDGWTQRVITLLPRKSGIYIWTNKLYEEMPEIRDTKVGVVNLFLRATDAALTINENADPDVRVDLDNALKAIVPGDPTSRASFVGVSMDIPVHSGRLALGTWQGLYLCDWGGEGGQGGGGYDGDDSQRERQVVATLLSVEDIKATRNTTIKAPRRGCHLVQDSVASALGPAISRARDAGAAPGLANILLRHTSASLTVNENADPTVRVDMEGALNRIVPESWNDAMFTHVDEGPDDMPGHVKSTLFGATLSVPMGSDGRLKMGTWQGVYLCEHRNVGGFGGGHAREVTVTLPAGAAEANTTGQTTITVTAPSRGCHDVTDQIERALAPGGALGLGLDVNDGAGAGGHGGVRTGWLNCFIQHTSASLTVCDGSDSDGAAAPGTGAGAGARLEDNLNRVVPETWNDEFFKHTYEGPDDMPGHVKSSLMGASITVPVVDGKLGLGPGQGVFLCEHRDTGGFGCNLNRSVVLTLQGCAK